MRENTDLKRGGIPGAELSTFGNLSCAVWATMNQDQEPWSENLGPIEHLRPETVEKKR